MSPTISTGDVQIEILAPPATVRAVFLDFARYNEWHQGWDITLVDSNKSGSELQPGDALKVKIHGMKFSPYVQENTPECFIWTGSVPGVIGRTHYFRFIKSKVNAGGTTFIQSEAFTGGVTYLFWPWRNKKFSPSENWLNFNEALKKEAEKAVM